MTQSSAIAHNHEHHNTDSIDVFGFWIYIMTDCVLFASLFAAFAVLHNNTYGGPSLGELVSLPYVFAETMFLLLSSFTFGLAIIAMYKGKRSAVVGLLTLTFLLGLGFVGLEVNEFVHLYLDGHSWHASGAMSAFYTLVGTHGLHVSFGLLWMATMTIQILRYGITKDTARRLTYLGLFWAFLDIVWIFVFTIVYLMGAA